MKNLITKALGIAGITALSFLPLKDVQGQRLVDKEEAVTYFGFAYISTYDWVFKDFRKFVRTNKKINLGDGSYINLKFLTHQIGKNIKELPRKEQLEFIENYLENAVKIMCASNYYSPDISLCKEGIEFPYKNKVLKEGIEMKVYEDKKTLTKELKLKKEYARTLMGSMAFVADNL